MIDPSAFIHPKAHVEDSRIGARTKVWQFASITRGAQIGMDCVIAPGAMIDGSHVGDGSKIGPGTKMGPGFRIGRSVFIGPNCTLCNDCWPVADGPGFDMERFLSGELISIRIDAGASIGANAVVLPGVVIGAGAFVAAGAVCGRNVPDGHLFTRDGVVRPLASVERRNRMRQASAGRTQEEDDPSGR